MVSCVISHEIQRLEVLNFKDDRKRTRPAKQRRKNVKIIHVNLYKI